MKLNDEQIQFLKEDRQWLRTQRLMHAKHQKKKAESRADKTFWQYVIEMNAIEIR